MSLLKIILLILSCILFFDKFILLISLSIYYIIQKYIYKKNIESPLKIIKKHINPKKRIKYYLEIINNNYKYNYTLLTPKKENMSNFNSSKNFTTSLESIFKNNNMNFNAYPNVEINPEKPLFDNNKFLPECCLYYNEYSTSKGCPCITPDQQYYLQRRGINKHKDDLFTNKSNNNYKNIYFSPSLAFKNEQFPFNPLTSKKYNVNYVGAPPEQTDASLNEFILLTNTISYDFEG